MLVETVVVLVVIVDIVVELVLVGVVEETVEVEEVAVVGLGVGGARRQPHRH